MSFTLNLTFMVKFEASLAARPQVAIKVMGSARGRVTAARSGQR